MPSHSVADAYSAHGIGPRLDEVRRVLALAPRPAREQWSGDDLRLWVRLVAQVTDVEIEQALTLATAWGASDRQSAAIAAHILLVRIAPAPQEPDAPRLRRNINAVCAHLRSAMPRELAKRLPRVENALPELSSAVIWAYFFACLSVLLFSIAVTR